MIRALAVFLGALTVAFVGIGLVLKKAMQKPQCDRVGYEKHRALNESTMAKPQTMEGPPCRDKESSEKRPLSSRAEIFQSALGVLGLFGVGLGILYAKDTVHEMRVQTAELKTQNATENRAWVGTTGVTNVTFTVGKPVRLQVAITNTGQSPALNVTSISRMREITSPEVFAPTYDPSDSGTSMVIHPNMRVGPTHEFRIPMSDGVLALYKSGARRLYVYGEIRYRDIFKAQHTTTYCQYLGSDLVFHWCPTYNDAD